MSPRRSVAGMSWLPLCAATLTGCMSMSGLGGSADYACGAPEGVACDSVSGTYSNAVQNNLPSQRWSMAAPNPVPASASGPGRPDTVPTPGLATALRSPPRVLRLWTKPWEDADNDLYDEGYVYVQIDSGRWLIEHAHRAIREEYAPLRPPPPANPPEAETTGPRPEQPAFPQIDLPAGNPR